MACENTTGRRTFTVTWIIDNFEYCIQKEGERIKSPTFVADILANTKWSLWIYPRQGDYIFLYLYRESDSKGPLEIKINYEFALLTADGSCHLFDTTEENFSTSSYSNSTFVDQDNLFTDFLPNGNLIVRCKMWYDSKKESEGYCKMHTHVGVEKKILTWSVKKFSMLEKGMRPTLKIKSTTNQKLIMSLKLSLTEDKHEALEMSFIYPNSQVQPMYYSNKLFILDSKNVAIPWGDAGVFFDDLSKESKFSLAITKGEIMRKKSQYLREDVLSLLCECAFSTGVTTREIENSGIYPIPVENQNASFSSLELSKSTATPIPDTPFELKNDIASMLNEGILCDVTLKTKTESFHAHWFILNARSLVFRAMFQSDMKESVQNCIQVQDVDSKTMRIMLLYMYTDVLEDLQLENASKLYEAADKYQILSLKDKCSSFLKVNLNAANECDVLQLADLHHDEHLKVAVQEYILKQGKDIINSNKWKLFMQTNLQLAAETMMLKFKE